MWQGALGGRLLGIWCWGRTRKPVWVLGAEPCSIPNGDGEGCLLVAHGFKFFKPFFQLVYTKLLEVRHQSRHWGYRSEENHPPQETQSLKTLNGDCSV